MKPTFACVLKLGGDYLPEHARLLATQVRKHTTIDHEFVCFTDSSEHIPGVRSIALENNWPGWWSVPEVFRCDGPTIVTGLDTIIRGNIDDLFKIATNSRPKDFWMIRSFRPPIKIISGIMAWNGDWSWLYEQFDYEKYSKRLRGEEDYTNEQLKKNGIIPGILQDVFKDSIFSYKRHCSGGISFNCKVLVFHGHPRPFEVPELWSQILEEYPC